jgi:hypothetical protein
LIDGDIILWSNFWEAVSQLAQGEDLNKVIGESNNKNMAVDGVNQGLSQLRVPTQYDNNYNNGYVSIFIVFVYLF